MTKSLSRSLRLSVAAIATFAVCPGLTAPAWAQAPIAPPPAAAPPAVAEAQAATPQPLTAPSMAGPLALNADPIHFGAAGLGDVYLTGVVSGLGLFQSAAIPGDKTANVDLSNGMAIIQKIDGVVQFYAQGGGYSLPALGVNYHITQRLDQASENYFGLFPVGYLKIVPSDTFSVQAGKLPSLIGDEYTFTFQNMNIERGLLWSLEPAISRGVQANLTTGPVAWALSWNDGFYSTHFDWMSGSATWTINPANTLVLSGGSNLGRSGVSPDTAITAPFQFNNADIVNLIYTYNAAPWTISPYFQYTHNRHSATFTPGFTKDASTWGGAVLANYSINDNWNLAGRVEYLNTSGSATDGTVNVFLGPGSSGWSFTVTPTWQNGIFFARAEGSLVAGSSTTAGFAFGNSGSTKTQGRFVLETGVLF